MLELMTASKQPEGHIGLDGTISLVGAITGTLTVNTLSECSAIYGNEAFCSISGNSNGTAVRTALRLNLDTLVTSNAFFDQSNVGTGRRAVQVIWNGSWLISYGGNAKINFTKVARNGGNLNTSSALGWARAGAAYSANNFTGYMFGGVNSTLCGRITSPQTGQTTAVSITPPSYFTAGALGHVSAQATSKGVAYIKNAGMGGFVRFDMVNETWAQLEAGPEDIHSDGVWDGDDAIYFVGGPRGGKVTTLHRYGIKSGRWTNTPLNGDLYDAWLPTVWLSEKVHMQWYNDSIYMWRIDNAHASAKQMYKIL